MDYSLLESSVSESVVNCSIDAIVDITFSSDIFRFFKKKCNGLLCYHLRLLELLSRPQTESFSKIPLVTFTD